MTMVKVINCADVFYFAEKEYGIDWNTANNVFFGNALEYGRHTTVYPGDWAEYISLDEEPKAKASDYSKDDLADMDDNVTSHIILHAYLEAIGIFDTDVLVDCT